MDAHIRIQKQDYFAPRLARADVASMSRTASLVESDRAHPMTLRNRRRVVVRAIIHHEAFPRRQSRLRQRYQAPLQRSRSIVNRDND
jgi:hypothetical protein